MGTIDFVALGLMALFSFIDFLCGFKLSLFSLLGWVVCLVLIQWLAVPLGTRVSQGIECDAMQGIAIAIMILIILVMGTATLLKLDYRRRLKIEALGEVWAPSLGSKICGALVGFVVAFFMMMVISWGTAVISLSGVDRTLQARSSLDRSVMYRLTNRTFETGVYTMLRVQGIHALKAKRLAFFFANPRAALNTARDFMFDDQIHKLIYDRRFINLLKTGDPELIQIYPGYNRLLRQADSMKRVERLIVFPTNDPDKQGQLLTKVLAEFGKKLKRLHDEPSFQALIQGLGADNLLRSDQTVRLMKDPRFMELLRFLLFYQTDEA